MKPLLRYWAPVVAWMALIFTGSSDTMSGQRSSRIIGPVLRWLFPHISPEATDFWITLARKCAHTTEYAILALLLWRALHRSVRRRPRPWVWSHCWGAFLLACLYAVSDEGHQVFVPGREGSVWDVLIDALGAGLGLLALWLWQRRREQN